LGALKKLFIILLLISCNQVYKNSYSEELLNSVKKGELSKVRDLIKRGANVNIKDKDGKTPLHIAVENNYEDIVKVLIQNNADVNIKDNNGNTPLHIAIMNGNEFIIKELLKAKADKNIKNNEGKTPYDLAKELNYEDIINDKKD